MLKTHTVSSMFYKYSEIKNELIEKNAERPPVENSDRSYNLELLEHHPKGFNARYKNRHLILLWEDILLICVASLKTSYMPADIILDIFVKELRASFRVNYDDIVFISFPFPLYGTIYQNLETFLNYIITKNYDIQFDSYTTKFLRKLKKEKKRTSDIREMINRKPPELHEFTSKLQYEKYVWRTYLDYQKKFAEIKNLKTGEQKYCLILKNYPPSRKKEIIESLSIIKKISEEKAEKKLTLPMLLLKNVSKEMAIAISKELEYIDADVRIITMEQFRKIRNLRRIK